MFFLSTEESKFEAGYQTEIDLTEEFNNVYEYDINIGDFLFQRSIQQ